MAFPVNLEVQGWPKLFLALEQLLFKKEIWDRTVPHGVGVLPVQDEPQQQEDNSMATRLSWQRSEMAW